MDSYMNYISLVALFTYIITLNIVFASPSSPHCPVTPIKATIGEELPNGWKIWKTYEIYSWWKGFKYRNFKETYQIDKWDDTLEGYFSISSKQTRYYIACCKHKDKEDYFLCALKEMENVQFCETPLIRYGHEKPIFHCIPWGDNKRIVS